MIYLDNAATTKIDPEVLAAMEPYLTDSYGNAGTSYSFGREAAKAVKTAREQVAMLFGCKPDNVVFTSGGSESNNMVFKGLHSYLLNEVSQGVEGALIMSLFQVEKKLELPGIVTSAIEHDSVLRAADNLATDCGMIDFVAPDNTGVIPFDKVKNAINKNTRLVSIMYANNETGAVNDINAIGQLCKEKNILFHTDCVQAAGQYPLDVEGNCVDFASVSSHKIHGPKGVGALYIRDKTILQPLIHGGHAQEFGLRGGTENVPGIVGFGKACELAVNNMTVNRRAINRIKQQFYSHFLNCLARTGLSKEIVHINGCPVTEDGKVLNLRIDGINAETLLFMLDTKGVCASAGSACQSHESKPSHVLTAMGLTPEEAMSSIRLSFSKFTTEGEALEAASIMASCVSTLSKM